MFGSRRHRQTSDRSPAWAGAGLTFLVGHARSGTTVLARAIGSHPEVGYWEEPALLERLAAHIERLEPLARHLLADSSVVDLTRTVRDGSLREQFADQITVAEGDVDATTVDAARALTGALRTTFLARSGGSILLEKTPRQLTRTADALRWFPEAKIIHIVRDGRDVVCSGLTWQDRWGRPPWVPKQGDLLEVIAKQWDRQVSTALHARSPAVLLVRYEDLAADGRTVLSRCLDHLGLPWSRGVERFLATGMGGLHSASVGRWQTELTDQQVDTVQRFLGPTLAAAGYEVR